MLGWTFQGVCDIQVADGLSAVFGGAAFDLLHLNVRQVSTVMLGFAVAPTAVWTAYAWWQCKVLSEQGQKDTGYSSKSKATPV